MGEGQLQEGVASLEGLEGAQLEQFVSVPEHFEHLYEHKGQEFIDKYLPSGQDVQLNYNQNNQRFQHHNIILKDNCNLVYFLWKDQKLNRSSNLY